jgi:hypothetical protein
MRVIQITARPDADGVLRLSIPVGPSAGEFEVAVVLNPRPAAPANPAAAKTPEELGWPPGFFENVIGSIDDDTFFRHPQGEFEKREPLD